MADDFLYAFHFPNGGSRQEEIIATLNERAEVKRLSRTWIDGTKLIAIAFVDASDMKNAREIGEKIGADVAAQLGLTPPASEGGPAAWSATDPR
jgi:hypothetical protein